MLRWFLASMSGAQPGCTEITEHTGEMDNNADGVLLSARRIPYGL